MRLSIPIIMLALFAAPMAQAAEQSCSIHPPAGASDSDLAGLAKISKAEAKKTALADVKANAKVESGELEAENGCLIYSFDIKVPHKSGIEEIAVDAGTGKILSRAHETPQQQRQEKD